MTRARSFTLMAAAVTLLFSVGAGTATAAASAGRGLGDDRGFAVATPRLQAEAAKGNARAQTMLGFAYATGRGVPQNYVAAAAWYRLAAERRNATAQYLLGLMYDRGHGVPQDKIIAHKWLILAAAGASSRERDYYVRIRDAVATTMNADQIAEAQALAFQWTAAHDVKRLRAERR